MSSRNKHSWIQKGGAVVFAVVFLLSNFPASLLGSGFEYLFQELSDRKVVDTLYLAEKDSWSGRIVDNLLVPRAEAAVAANSARTFYGDTTNAGTLKWATGASNSTGAEISAAGSSASNIAFVRAFHAPTRDEVIAGHIKLDGRLDIFTVTGGQDDAADDTAQWNKTGVTSALTCDATTFGTCWRPFDIAYEALSGDAMVAFGINATTGTLQYCTYNGSAWSPASCTTPSTFTLTGSTGALRWVRLIPRGEGLKGTRSDEILMIASDANSDIFAAIWDGSSWTELTTITTSASTFEIQNFDGAWEETTGNALVVWSEGTGASTAPYNYKRWIRSTTDWDSSGSSLGTIAVSNIGHWVAMEGAAVEGKNHIAVITNSGTTVGNNCSTTTNCRAQAWIWSGGASPSMTLGNEWGSQEPIWQPLADVAVEGINTDVQAIYASSDGATADASNYQTWVEGTGFSAITDMTGAMGDDAAAVQLTGHPNTNEIFITGEDIDSDCNGNAWSGTAIGTWDTTGCNSVSELALAPLNDTVQNGEGLGFFVASKVYSPWSRNWRFYDGVDTTNTPTTALAAENTTPTGINASSVKFRLRFSVAELTNVAQTDARKKLQYATGNPDTLTTTWTDVDDPAGAGVWRYVDCNGGDGTICNDDQTLTAAVLSGTPTAGWWVQDKDAAAGAAMDHSALQLRELEFSVEANGASNSTTYYFRMYDTDQLTPVFREQDNDGANDCATATCTYPSLTTGAATVPVVTTDFASNVGATTARLHGSIVSTPGAVTEHGFAYSTSATLSSGVSTTTLGAGSAGQFQQSISGLSNDQTYYFRAYATSGGIGYGNIIQLTSGNTTATRSVRLFEGYTLKFYNGSVQLHQR